MLLRYFLVQMQPSGCCWFRYLCKYSSHSSKAGDLKKQVVGAEKNTTDKSVDWLQYYNDMAPQAQKCMYVYLSPNETGNPIKSLCIDLDVVHSFPYCCFYIYFSFGNARPGPKTHSSGAQASVITKKNWLCQPKISIGFWIWRLGAITGMFWS